MRPKDKKENMTKANKLVEQRYLEEKITLDIKVGDTILGGKFLNKKIVIKTIKKDGKGGYLINGKPLLRFRIIKDQPDDK
jgi:hypothetical protein